jgi:hypothetical protein
MADRYPSLSDTLVTWLQQQHLFFVATAGRDGRVNVSPKGHDSLRVLGPDRIVWLNLTGSGNETAAHVAENGRMTLMWCAFEGAPRILRVYGTARVVHAGDDDFEALVAGFPALPGARQVFELQVDLVQTSCGYAVPLFEHVAQRDVLTRWADKKGPEGIEAYWERKNLETIDGTPTGMADALERRR